VVQDRTLRSDGGAFDVLPGEARICEQHDPGRRPGADRQPTVHDRQPLVRVRLLLQRAGTDVRGDQLIAWPGREHRNLQRSRPNLVADPVQLPSGKLRGDVRPAEGPAAAECEVKGEPEFIRLLGGVTKVGQKGIGTKLRRGRAQRIDVCNLDSAESSVGHRGELPLQLGSGYRRAEPPPAHQR
jgi:hypothetical protein